MKKKLTIILSLVVILCINTSASVLAISQHTLTNEEIISWFPSEINVNDPDIQEEINFIKEYGVSLSDSESVYYEIVTDVETGTTLEINEKDEIEYYKSKIEDKVNKNLITPYSWLPGNTYTRSNSWIKLDFKSVTLSSGSYRFYTYYKWLKKPFFTKSDVIALGHDSNFSFDTASLYSKHYQYINYVETQNISYNYNNVNNAYATTAGVSIKFPMPSSPDTAAATYNGYLRVDGRFTNSNIRSGNLHILYGHSELAFDFNLRDAISFATSGIPSFSITGSQDEFTFTDQFLR